MNTALRTFASILICTNCQLMSYTKSADDLTSKISTAVQECVTLQEFKLLWHEIVTNPQIDTSQRATIRQHTHSLAHSQHTAHEKQLKKMTFKMSQGCLPMLAGSYLVGGIIANATTNAGPLKSSGWFWFPLARFFSRDPGNTKAMHIGLGIFCVQYVAGLTVGPLSIYWGASSMYATYMQKKELHKKLSRLCSIIGYLEGLEDAQHNK